MSTLMQASRQWATRPSDQRFLTLTDMLENQRALRMASTAKVIENRALEVQPREGDDGYGLQIAGTHSVTAAIEQAQAARLTHGTSEDDRNRDVRDFLTKRFSKTRAAAIQAAHIADEGRPIETVWDAVTGITAYARGVQYQDERVKLEREAGSLLRTAA